MNRVWTEEELDILRRDREAKVPVPVTAAKLGRPVPATYARARLIGTLVQPHQSWDEASVARLRALVMSDPPMTDKRIAAELGRTVTQIRWKMQDLGLIGVRDLSKLAKMTASESGRSPAAPKPAQTKRVAPPVIPAQQKAPIEKPLPAAAPVVQKPAPEPIEPRAALAQALKRLGETMAERLKKQIADSEAGMVQAAMAAIAEKSRIDRQLAEIAKPKIVATPKIAVSPQTTAEKVKPQTERVPEKTAKPQAAPKPAAPKPVAAKPRPLPRAAAPQKPQPAPQRPALQVEEAPPAPKIVVTEAPAAPRPVEPEPAAVQVSGRGGWKSVRRDPARIAAQAKAKATNRADAVDLAQAAQAAIERFIAERGVTRTETGGIPALVSRLQARGYIVVRDETGWMIDQRHRIDDESALMAFAEARGITLDVAA